MAGDPRYMIIEGRLVDKASAECQKMLQKMKATTQKQSTQVGDLVNENMGRSMKAFNEKTEKGRMIMTALGTTVGGQATYMAGNIMYVVGAFKKWELVAMGVMGAVVALGAKFYSMANEGLAAAIKGMKELNQQNEAFIKSKARMIELEMLTLAGLSKEDLAVRDIRKQYQATDEKLKGLREEYEKLQMVAEAGGIGSKGAQRRVKEIDAEIKKAEDALETYREMVTTLRQLEKLKETPELVPITPTSGKGAGKYSGGQMGWLESVPFEGFMGMLVPAGMSEQLFQQMRDSAQRAAEFMKITDADTWSLRESQLKEQYDLEVYWEDRITAAKEAELERRQDNQRKALENTIGLFSELGELVTRGTKAHTAARIASIIMQAAYDAAVYTYKGVGALATEPWAAAQYFTAAALAAAVAAGKVQGAASGGRGGASISSRESAQGGWKGKEPERSEGLTIHIHAGVLTGSEAGQEILNAIRNHDDAWSPGRVQKGMG